MARFYGFQYTDGINTTTGGDHGQPLRIAGQLFAFESEASRDEWLEQPRVYDCRVPSNVGVFRRAVTTRALPSGWRTSDAEDYGPVHTLTSNG